MDKKTIIDKVKSLFAEAPEQVEEEVKYVDVKTEDNRILRMDDIAVDVAVEEITEDGEVQEIEDGSYVLEDGNTLVIAGGIITEIIEAEAEESEEEVVEEEMAEATEEEVVAEVEEEVKEDFDGEVAQMLIDALTKTNERLEAIESKFLKQEEENKELKEQVEKFAKSPSVEHTETKQKFSQKESKPKSPLHTAIGIK